MKHNISKILLILACLVGPVSTHAKAQSKLKTKSKFHFQSDQKSGQIKPEMDFKRNWKLIIKLKQRGEVWDSKLENSFRYNVYFEPNYKLKMSDNFFLSVKAGVGGVVGSVQSRFGDLRSTNFIVLKDSRVYFKKHWSEKRKSLKLSFGAINQSSFLSNSRLYMLMSRRALPGFEQVYKYKHHYANKKAFGFDIRFFEGIPTSQSISLDFNEKNKLPMYYNGRLELYLKKKSKDLNYRIGVHGGVFNFSSLPSVIANESRLYGNSVQGFGAAAQFVYDYAGWYAGWNAVLSIKRWEFEPFIDVSTNTKAPSGRNQAQNYGVEIRYRDQSLYTLGFEPFFYFNESDASIASYNGSRAGHNNREGYGMNLALKLAKKNLKFRLTYMSVEVLESNSNLQVPYQFVGFNMEYKYEL